MCLFSYEKMKYRKPQLDSIFLDGDITKPSWNYKTYWNQVGSIVDHSCVNLMPGHSFLLF